MITIIHYNDRYLIIQDNLPAKCFLFKIELTKPDQTNATL